jgi:thioredoxin 2
LGVWHNFCLFNLRANECPLERFFFTVEKTERAETGLQARTLPWEVVKDMSVAKDMTDAQLIRCPTCGATNRVPMEKIKQGLEPVCGRCKTPLPVYSKPTTVTDATFSAEVERSPVPVLLDLWAEWCGPCRMIAPVIEKLAVEMAGRVRVAKLNIDENPVTAGRFNVRSIPTLLVLKEGREVDRIVGVQPKSEIARRLERVIA